MSSVIAYLYHCPDIVTWTKLVSYHYTNTYLCIPIERDNNEAVNISLSLSLHSKLIEYMHTPMRNPRYTFFFRCAVVVVVGSVLVLTTNILKTSTDSHRSLSEKFPTRVDSRPMCSGPRQLRDLPQSHHPPFYQRAVYALPLGQDEEYGRLNNKLVQLVNAMDVAWDSGGHTVVVVSDWVVRWMSAFFPDDDSWEQLERDFPIVRQEKVAQSSLETLTVKTEELMSRRLKHLKEKKTWDVVQARRVRLLHYLFSSLAGEPCHFYHHLQGFLHGRFNETKFIAVHVRNMDGKCLKFNVNPHAVEQCSKSPEYIQSVIDSSGLAGNEQQYPIVLLSDMQDHAKLHSIQDTLEKVVVPYWDFGGRPSMAADLVLGAMSELFIGEQGSSGSRNIGIMREAFGKTISSNYIFMKKEEAGRWSSFHPKHPYEWWVGQDNQ